MAYTKVMLKRVYDDVALGVRLLLMEEVGWPTVCWHTVLEAASDAAGSCALLPAAIQRQVGTSSIHAVKLSSCSTGSLVKGK